MSSRIRVLPPELADQIAAGEVVERPASVVKELAENALDAGARRIDIEVERGGLGLISVTDDGGGMTPDEAHLALKRHATSKLRAIDDLFTLSSMGFRGEALPSIAAVSRLTLTTRAADAPPEAGGYQLQVEGGIAGEARPVGAPVGTRVEVRDLCANVPARLKFMKSEATESAHIAEAVLRLALAFPSVHFRLRSDGRQSHDLPPHANGLERARVALGRGRAPARLQLASGVENGISVEAYLGSPADSANTARLSYLFVNHRFIRDRSLLHAVTLGYGETLDRGRYPLAVVNVTLSGQTVDVNVHPQKLEVRFARPQEVYAAVRHAVAAAVAKAPWLTQPGQAMAPSDRRRGGDGSVEVLTLPPGENEAHYRDGAPSLSRLFAREPQMGYAERRRRAEEAMKLFAPPTEPLFRAPWPPPVGADGSSLPGRAPLAGGAAMPDGTPWPDGAATPDGLSLPDGATLSDGAVMPDGAPMSDGAQQQGSAAMPGRAATPGEAQWSGAAMSGATMPGSGTTGPGMDPRILNPGSNFRTGVQTGAGLGGEAFFSSLIYLGQLHRTYLVCQAPGELVLIDQHAAHERVAFQRLREAHARRAVRSQRLLLPATVELEPELAATAAEHADLLHALGFEVERFGERTLAVRALPDVLAQAEPTEALTEVLGELAARAASELVSDRLDHVLATMACHSVVRAGDVLGEREVRALLTSMDGIDYRAHCPHGRPVLLRMSLGEIERRFGRT